MEERKRKKGRIHIDKTGKDVEKRGTGRKKEYKQQQGRMKKRGTGRKEENT